MIGKDGENKLGQIIAKTGRVKLISEVMNSTVMPGIQGGPLMHVIAAKAVAFAEALKPEFKKYAEQIIKNAKTLADALSSYDFNIISGGTDNHVMLIDLSNKNISGKEAEILLHKAGMTVNKNMVPFDSKSPFVTSGIRIGTAALTTRGFKENEMKAIASMIHRTINQPENAEKIKNEIVEMTNNFPLYAW
jgi:glycine hydroxymethyltransferase